MSRSHRLLLWAAATDRTFELREDDGAQRLVGKCIHCRRRLAIDVRGRGPSVATVEHILPKTHGGTDALENLAVACRRCNSSKGVRVDGRRVDDPVLQAVIATLRARRAQRMRAPPPGLTLPRIGSPGRH